MRGDVFSVSVSTSCRRFQYALGAEFADFIFPLPGPRRCQKKRTCLAAWSMGGWGSVPGNKGPSAEPCMPTVTKRGTAVANSPPSLLLADDVGRFVQRCPWHAKERQGPWLVGAHFLWRAFCHHRGKAFDPQGLAGLGFYGPPAFPRQERGLESALSPLSKKTGNPATSHRASDFASRIAAGLPSSSRLAGGRPPNFCTGICSPSPSKTTI